MSDSFMLKTQMGGHYILNQNDSETIIQSYHPVVCVSLKPFSA